MRDDSECRWTVDEPEDFELIKTILEALAPHKPNFTWQDVLEFLASHPKLAALNQGFARNEGLEKSLAADKQGGES
jgi:spore coat polysaccharide biosynthesis protein SpsF